MNTRKNCHICIFCDYECYNLEQSECCLCRDEPEHEMCDDCLDLHRAYKEELWFENLKIEKEIDNHIHDYESYRLKQIEQAEIEAIEKGVEKR
jgi:hypothetical protein